jgi:small subunit ribosomal protein S17
VSETENENQVDETAEASEAPVAEAETPEPATEEPAATEAEQTESPAVDEPAAAETDAPAAAEGTVPSGDSPQKKQRSRKHVPRHERRQRPKPKRATPAGERKPITRLPKPEHERGRRQERRGVVVSSTMDKTIVVKVDVIKLHPRYKKVIRRSQKFHAHDEQNEANVGDVVRIIETRPFSKTKNWRLAEVVEAAK